MPNPLYGQFGGQQNNNGFSAFMDDFRRLQQTVKNPRQEVERLLQSGMMEDAEKPAEKEALRRCMEALKRA